MKCPIITSALTITLATASPHYGVGSVAHWKPAGKGDFRGPCPMLNTLSNHGFLPHDGRNLTREVVVNGLATGLNFNTSLGNLMFEMALIANPSPNATYFTLWVASYTVPTFTIYMQLTQERDQLNRHNVLEHDASMSRSDKFFGNNHIFNETVFNETRAYWTEPILDAQMLANGKLARQITSRSQNPTYTFTSTMEEFSLGEVAAPVVAFGDRLTGKVNRTLVEYFFENERLPVELGWVKTKKVVSLADITLLTSMIRNATSLMTPSKSGAAVGRRDLHVGGH